MRSYFILKHFISITCTLNRYLMNHISLIPFYIYMNNTCIRCAYTQLRADVYVILDLNCCVHLYKDTLIEYYKVKMSIMSHY